MTPHHTLIIHEGETFSCDNGHPYATAKADIFSPDVVRLKDFTFANEQGVVKPPCAIICKVCGGYVWSIEKHHFGRAKLGETYFDMKTHP